MFNSELKRRIRDLESNMKEMRIKVYCLKDYHEWIVAQGMVIRCKYCHKRADKMPDKTNTQSDNQS